MKVSDLLTTRQMLGPSTVYSWQVELKLVLLSLGDSALGANTELLFKPYSSQANVTLFVVAVMFYIMCADQAYVQNAVNAVREVSLKNWEVHISCSMEHSFKYGK